jgi:hypothetical protein
MKKRPVEAEAIEQVYFDPLKNIMQFITKYVREV